MAITPKQFKAAGVTAATTVYTVTANQKGIVKGLAIANNLAAPCTFTLNVFGIQLYTTRTLGPYECFECASAINKIGLGGDTIVVTGSAAVEVLGSALETPAT
jgi:hypothetical protein